VNALPRKKEVNMKGKWFSLLFVAMAATLGHAADVDNSHAPINRQDPSSIGKISYFEGVWVGTWPKAQHRTEGGTGADLTIEIGGRNDEGIFRTKYSWGPGTDKRGYPTPPGSLIAEGRENGEKFVFEWKRKDGGKGRITLEKYKDNEIKASFDRGGSGSSQFAYVETTLHRK
jgi:hypothetical protein